MLAALAPASLARLRFPLGELTKPQVRALAAEAGLPVAVQARVAGPLLPRRHRQGGVPGPPRRRSASARARSSTAPARGSARTPASTIHGRPARGPRRRRPASRSTCWPRTPTRTRHGRPARGARHAPRRRCARPCCTAPARRSTRQAALPLAAGRLPRGRRPSAGRPPRARARRAGRRRRARPGGLPADRRRRGRLGLDRIASRDAERALHRPRDRGARCAGRCVGRRDGALPGSLGAAAQPRAARPDPAPRSLSPLDRTAEVLGSRRDGYGIRLVSAGPDAVIALQGGGLRTLKARAARRDADARLQGEAHARRAAARLPC